MTATALGTTSPSSDPTLEALLDSKGTDLYTRRPTRLDQLFSPYGDVLTLNQVSEVLAVPIDAVTELLFNQELPVAPVRRLGIYKQDLLAFLRARAHGPAR